MTLILCHDFHGTGGIERVTRDAATAFAADGPVRVLAAYGAGTDPKTSPDVRLICLFARRGRPLNHLVKVLYLLVALFMLVAEALQSHGRVFVSHVELAPLLRLQRGLLGRLRSVVVLHGYETWKPLAPSVHKGLERVTSCLAVSDYTADVFSRHNPGFSVRRVRLPVAAPETVPPFLHRWSHNVLTVSRLTHANAYKGVDTLLMAWPKLFADVPGVRLHVVGDGDARSSLQNIVASWDDEGMRASVAFLGRTSDADLQNLYERCTIFCLPGRENLDPGQPAGEGLGLVFLEASSYGLPVVVGVSGGSRETVLHGETGILLSDEASPADVAEALSTLTRHPERCNSMGERGRVWVRNEHNASAFRADLISAFISSTRHAKGAI